MHRQCYEYAKEEPRYGGPLRQYRARWLSGAMSQHHLAIMTKPSLSCLLCFLCTLAIPIFPFLKVEEFLIYLYNIYHKRFLYIGMVGVGQQRSHTFRKSAFPWRYELNPEYVFIKDIYGQKNMGVYKKR